MRLREKRKSNIFKKEIADAGNLLPDTSHHDTSAKIVFGKCANKRTICCNKKYTFESASIEKKSMFIIVYKKPANIFK